MTREEIRDIKRYRVFKTQFNKAGNMVIIEDQYYNKKIKVGYNLYFGDCGEVAADHLDKLGIKIEGIAAAEKCIYLMTTNFKVKL